MTGIVKKFLDALKSEAFSRDIIPLFMEALTTLVKCNMTAEVFRALALFITYAYHKSSLTGSRTPKNGTLPSRMNSVATRPTINTMLDGGESVSSILTKRELGNKVLEMYTGLLCETGSTSNIQRFAKTVTNKAGVPVE